MILCREQPKLCDATYDSHKREVELRQLRKEVLKR